MPVVRRGPLTSSLSVSPSLTVTVDKDGTVHGTATPGARVEVANLSTAPTSHLLPHDLAEVTTANADGRVTMKMATALGGDVLQVQVRADAAAAAAATLQLRVDAADRKNDPRAAFVSLKRLRVDVAPSATGLLLISARTALPLSEPDAVLRFTNLRTQESVDVVVDPLGHIARVELPGGLGDSIDVAVTDDIATRPPRSAGTLTVAVPQLANPAPVAKDAPFVKLVTIPGRLFLEKLGLGKQGAIGNCPVIAGTAALAAVSEDAVRDLIRDRGDGTFVVTFHPPGLVKEIVVDSAFFTSNGNPIYGTGVTRGDDVELWFPLVEKAYADLVGGYDVLARGLSAGKILSDLTGRDNAELWLKDKDVDHVWQRMQRARSNGQAMTCGTYPFFDYQGTGLYPNHAYSVHGVEVKDGERYVNLRNPHGGAGFSGEFQLPLADFVSLYQVLNIC